MIRATELGRVCEFNAIAGIGREYRNVDPDAIQFNLIKEEFKELQEGIDDNDRKEVVDALGDLLVVVGGAINYLGYDPDEVLKIINDSNMSKFCDNEEDAIQSVEAYEDSEEYRDVHYRKVRGRYVIYGYKKDVTVSCKPKILKGIHYQPSKLGEIL